MRRFIALIPLLAVFGCAGMSTLHGVIPDNEQLTSAQQTYLQDLEKQELRFEIPKAESNDAWGRAQAFVAQHSGMKIQTATDFVLETYNPTFEDGPDFSLGLVRLGYHVSRSPIGDKFQFDVNCTGPALAGPYLISKKGKQLEKTRVRNARIMAQYILTGKMPHPELIIK